MVLINNVFCFCYTFNSNLFLLKSLDNQAVYEGEKLTTKASVTANFHKPKFRDFWLNTLEVIEFSRDTFVNGYSLVFLI